MICVSISRMTWKVYYYGQGYGNFSMHCTCVPVYYRSTFGFSMYEYVSIYLFRLCAIGIDYGIHDLWFEVWNLICLRVSCNLRPGFHVKMIEWYKGPHPHHVSTYTNQKEKKRATIDYIDVKLNDQWIAKLLQEFKFCFCILSDLRLRNHSCELFV